jgi:hypothetical protein
MAKTSVAPKRARTKIRLPPRVKSDPAYVTLAQMATTTMYAHLTLEFRRRMKTQGSLPSEDAALILLFSLVASGQIKLRRIDGWRKIPTVLRQHTTVAA